MLGQEITVCSEKNVLNQNAMSFEEREQQLREEEAAEQRARKKMKDSPFSNFYQFNREHSKEMIWLAGNHPKAHQILLFLLDQMDNYNVVMCSYAVFQEALEMSKATVTRSIKVLKDHNFITIYRSGTANVYAVNKLLAWSSWGNNYKYAKFDAKIIIAESEQKCDVDFDKPKILKVKDNDKA